MKQMLFSLLLSAGGTALVWKLVGDNVRLGVHKGLGFAFSKFPGAKAFVLANKDRLNQMLKDAEQGLEDAENDA